MESAGYLWNVAQPRPIVVAKSAPAATATPTTEQASGQTPPNGYSACLGCHDDHMMSQQRLTRDQWDRELNKMTGWGARLNPEQRSAILDYLSVRFKQ